MSRIGTGKVKRWILTMARLNKSLVNDLQSKTFEEKLIDSYTGIDFNYLGYDKSNPKSKLVLTGTAANVNRVLFWLSSKKTDYVREPNKGGILYELIGKINNDTNIHAWEEDIIDKFNNEFFGDMQMISLSLTPDKKRNKLVINMIVMDKILNRTFTVGTEASI